MLRCLAFLLPVLLTNVIAQAQLVNDGATIKIMSGAVVFCSGNVENKNAGTISNDGKLEVQGNFLNTAIYTTATADDSLIMSNGGNVTLNPGTSTISFLQINKTTNSDFVTLTASTTIGNKLIYNSGTLSTDPIANTYTLNAAAGVIFEFTAGREIVGRVRRTGWSNGVARIFNQPNMQITTNGGISPAEFTVNMIPEAYGGDPAQVEREVKRKFQFSQIAGSGYTSDIRFPYTATELNTNTEANLVPWNLPATEWTGRLTPVTRDAVNDWVSTTGISAADIAQEWKLADPKYTFNVTAFMRGAWNGANMNTALNSGGVLPVSQPYNVTPFDYTGTESVGSIPNANVVDWVLVEIRKPASGLPANANSSTIIGRKAGFILNSGVVVDLDGVTPISFNISKQGTGEFIVFRHRNHLAVMSNTQSSNTSGTYTNNYTSLANNYSNSGITNPPALLLTGSTYGLWAGDANRDGGINSSDFFVIRGQANVSATGYLVADANLDAGVNSSDFFVTRISANNGAIGHTSRVAKPAKSHVPE